MSGWRNSGGSSTRAWKPTRHLTDDELLAEIQRLIEADRRDAYRWECDLPECDGLPHEGMGHHHARAAQREPSAYRTWLIRTGRGWGKTKTGAETTRKRGLRKPRQHIAVIAKSHREVQNVCFEAKRAGLLAVIPPEDQLVYNKSSGSVKLTLTNGTIIRAFSAEDPDALRGYAFDFVWCDEYAAWPVQTAQAVMDMVWFCLREAEDPAVIVTTTLKPKKHVVDLLERAAGDQMVVVTGGHTLENRANLSEVALAEITSKYEGTRLGRQELGGELLEDVEGALWSLSEIENDRVLWTSIPPLLASCTGVDPATTSGEDADETGIVSVARGVDNHGYVLRDRSLRGTPGEWATAAWMACLEDGTECIVVEDNQGGEMCEFTLMTAWIDVYQRFAARGRMRPPIRRVHAGISKRDRAIPISLMAEQHRFHHVEEPDADRDLSVLEDQMTSWDGTVESKVTGKRIKGESPDRVDALVHAARYLFMPQPKTGERRVVRGERWGGTGRR